MLLGESVYTDYDFKAQIYGRVPDTLYRQQTSILQGAKEATPALRVMTLGYWDPLDAKGIAGIYAVQRASGFLPYVSTIELDKIIPEPNTSLQKL